MKVLLLGAYFLFAVSAVTDGAVPSPSNSDQINHYMLKIEILRDIIAEECPMYSQYQRQRRQNYDGSNQGELEADRVIYLKMFEDYIECRKINSELKSSKVDILYPSTSPASMSTTSILTTVTNRFTTNTTVTRITQENIASSTNSTTSKSKTTNIQTPTTTTATITRSSETITTPSTTVTTATTNQSKSTKLKPTTTHTTISTLPSALSTPIKCLTATNFTQSWRLDHSGSDIRPGGPHSYNGYACDYHVSTQWFRFTGAAGNRMLNTCPPRNSCGTEYPKWSDAGLPVVAGVISNINVYGVYGNDCKARTYPVQVMRCSEDKDHDLDLIYKLITSPFTGSSKCSHGFCGMI